MKLNDYPTMNDNYPSNSDAQILLLGVLARAAAQGWQAGRDPESYAGDCPYSYLLAPLKDAWLQGFGVGRTALA